MNRNIHSGNVTISAEIVNAFNEDMLDALRVTDENRNLIKEFSGVELRKLIGRALSQVPRYGNDEFFTNKYYITPLEERDDVD